MRYVNFFVKESTPWFTADPEAHKDCGNTCHVAVKAKDYIFHRYQKR